MFFILLTLEQEFRHMLEALMRPKERTRAAGGPRRANHQKTQTSNSARLATSRELFAYADAVGAAIPRLPGYLKASTVQHFLSVCVAALKAGANHGTC